MKHFELNNAFGLRRGNQPKYHIEGSRRCNWPDFKGRHDGEVCNYVKQVESRTSVPDLIESLSPGDWLIGVASEDQFAKGWSIRRINFLGDTWTSSLHADAGHLSAVILQPDIEAMPMSLAWRRWVQTKVFLSHVFERQADEELGDADTFTVEASWVVEGVKVALIICSPDKPQIVCTIAASDPALDHLGG